MPEFSVEARNQIVTDRANMYTSAELRDDTDTVVATYNVTGAFGTASGGEITLSSTITGTASKTHDFDNNPGTLVLLGSGGITETMGAGGPSSGKPAIVQNDLSTPTGEIFDGKEVNLTGLTLVQPNGTAG